MTLLEELIAEMQGADIVILNAGVGLINHDLHWDQERETIEVNVAGFAALANVAMRHFALPTVEAADEGVAVGVE